jgi:hypothetical protein
MMSVRQAVVIAGAIAAVIASASPAHAGRLVVTGHDADLHCAAQNLQCHFVAVAVNYARSAAPDPSRPVLVLDRGATPSVPTALDRALGSVPRTVLDPRSQLAGAPIDTRYSAIIVASDVTCGGCTLNEPGSTPDSDAINARRGDIEAFFNAGGGIVAFSGANHGGNDANTADDTYYSFVPVPVGGALVGPPFALTAEGRALGFTDGSGGTSDDINCCQTHNSFSLPPAGGALKVAETDSAGRAETLFAEGSISGGGIQPGPPPPPPGGGSAPPPPPPATPPPAPPTVGAGRPPLSLLDPANPLNPNNTLRASQAFVFPSTKRCVSKRNFRIRVVRPKLVTYVAAKVDVNGRQVPVIIRRERYRTVRGSVLRMRRFTARVDLRNLTKGRFRVAITAVTQTLVEVRGVRRYKTCARRERGGRPPV